MGMLALLTCGSCKYMTGTDAITKATPKYKQGEGMLPPAVGQYKVLGVHKGLKKYVVQYDNNIFRGGEIYHDSAAKTLKGWGIKTIVSITPTDDERKFCKKYGFELVEVPFDKSTGPSNAALSLFIKTVKTGSVPLYIHCIGGTHRASVLGVAYRVHVLGWPYEKALIEHGRLGGDLLADHIMLEAVK